MDEVVTAADANRRISELLRGVREEGRRFVVTSHGRPVAKIVPASAPEAAASGAKAALLDRLRAQPAQAVGRWTREELYEDEG